MSTFTSVSSVRDLFRALPALNKNLVDRCAYRRIHEKEESIIEFIGKCVELPKGGLGFLTSGSSEAILSALAFHLTRFRKEHENTKRPNFIVSELFHNVFMKFAVLFDVEMRTVPVDDNGKGKIDDYATRIDGSTFCVVGIAGTTETGTIDDLEALSKLAKKAGISFHVDAAVAGTILPYLGDAPAWNFSQIDIDSLNVSLGKYACGVPGIGILFLRSRDLVPSHYEYEMEYLAGGKTGDLGLLCTRNSFHVEHMYGIVRRLGRPGYHRYIQGCVKRARALDAFLQARGFEVIPTELPVVVFSHSNQTLMEAFVESMRAKGYTLSYAPVKALNGKRLCRIVIRSNVGNRAIRRILKEITKALLRHSTTAEPAYDKPPVWHPLRFSFNPIRIRLGRGVSADS